MQLSTVIDVTVHFMSDLIAAWLSTSTTILWLRIFSKSRFFATSEIAKGAFRLDAKQPKFDVINSSQKVATGRNLHEQLRNIACLQAVVR